MAVDVRDAEAVGRAIYETMQVVSYEVSRPVWIKLPTPTQEHFIEVGRELLASEKVEVGSKLWTGVGG